jgi:hypothetical protein
MLKAEEEEVLYVSGTRERKGEIDRRGTRLNIGSETPLGRGGLRSQWGQVKKVRVKFVKQ